MCCRTQVRELCHHKRLHSSFLDSILADPQAGVISMKATFAIPALTLAASASAHAIMEKIKVDGTNQG